MHCKSGADRAGLASALYLILKHKYSIEEAKKQLSFKHLHIKYSKTGILDFFFNEVSKNNITNKIQFLDWIKNKYDKKKLKKKFKANSLANLIVDKILKRE